MKARVGRLKNRSRSSGDTNRRFNTSPQQDLATVGALSGVGVGKDNIVRRVGEVERVRDLKVIRGLGITFRSISLITYRDIKLVGGSTFSQRTGSQYYGCLMSVVLFRWDLDGEVIVLGPNAKGVNGTVEVDYDVDGLP